MNRTRSTQKTWNKQLKLYNVEPFFMPNDRVMEVISGLFNGALQGKRIIELGAGTGCTIVALAKKGVHAYALDFSSESIKSIQYWTKKQNTNVRTFKKSITTLPFDAKYFDLVYSVGVMEHFLNPTPLLEKQLRLVKNNGFLLVDVPQKFTFYTIAKHIRMRMGKHPFGWETEFSVNNLKHLAKELKQDVFSIYGRDNDLITRMPKIMQPHFRYFFQKYLEDSYVGPLISLCIGLVIKKRI